MFECRVKYSHECTHTHPPFFHFTWKRSAEHKGVSHHTYGEIPLQWQLQYFGSCSIATIPVELPDTALDCLMSLPTTATKRSQGVFFSFKPIQHSFVDKKEWSFFLGFLLLLGFLWKIETKYLASLNCFPLCIKFQFIIDMKLQETMQVFSNV